MIPIGIYGALAKAQGELTNIETNSSNPHFKSKYADLGAILAVVRPVLSKHGICVCQSTLNGEGGTVGVFTALTHEDGSTVQSSLYLKPDKPNAHGVGSAITYARRYTLAALVGVAQEDDDANAAVQNRPRAKEPSQKERMLNWILAKKNEEYWQRVIDESGVGDLNTASDDELKSLGAALKAAMREEEE